MPPKAKTRKREKYFCGECEGCCTTEPCATCVTCLDKPSFGGPGKLKQKCLNQLCYTNPKFKKKENGSSTAQDPFTNFSDESNKSNTTKVRPDQNKLYANENDENQAPPPRKLKAPRVKALPAIVNPICENQAPPPPKLEALPEIVDPFCDDVLEFLLYSLDKPVYKRSSYYTLGGKFPVLKTGLKLRLGEERYHLKSTRFEGAYATIFHGSVMDSLNATVGDGGDDDSDAFDDDDEKQRVLKVQKPSFPWEFYICHELRQRLKSQEHSAKIADVVMKVNRAYMFDTGSIMINQYHKYGTLLSAFNKYKIMGISVPEELAMIIMVEVLSILDAMHECKIIHADIKPDNFLVMGPPKLNMDGFTVNDVFAQCPSSIKLIDFGRSIDMKLLPPGITFTKKVKTDGFMCVEMREDRPWTYQTDLYGAAAIAHVMLWGTYLNVHKDFTGRWNVRNSFKRYWNRTLWEEFFVTMLNVPSCDELPDLKKIKFNFMNAFLEKNVDFKLMTSQFENVMKQVRNDGTEKKKKKKNTKRKVEEIAVATPPPSRGDHSLQKLAPQTLDFSTPKMEQHLTPHSLQELAPQTLDFSTLEVEQHSTPQITPQVAHNSMEENVQNSTPNTNSINHTFQNLTHDDIHQTLQNLTPGFDPDNMLPTTPGI